MDERKSIESAKEEGREEGRREGHEVGLKEGILKIARTMLVANMDRSLIAQITGLSFEEIQRLEK